MTSLRRRLFVLLLAATGALWVCAVVWIYIGSRLELEHVLDTRLQEAAKMVHSLVAGGHVSGTTAAPPFQTVGYERQLSCQIWSFDGRLLAQSSGAPQISLAQESEGFGDRNINGESWRVYTIVDAIKGIRVAVGDRVELRNRLVRDLVLGLIGPALFIVPLLGALIWFGLGRGLSPVNRLAADIAARDGDDMRPIADSTAPMEIQPLLGALNGLFQKVETARKHERDITSFAAHELRTPLAGLKTQAQVALAAGDEQTRSSALRNIIVSVDRSTRLTRQLLILAKLDAMSPIGEQESVRVDVVLQEVIYGCQAPRGVRVVIDPKLKHLSLRGDHECLYLVLRNLHENAIAHSPDGGTIVWRALPAGLSVEDDGPGIAEDELALVTQRFYRGRRAKTAGTGLGLTIATMAAERMASSLTIENRSGRHGLRCTVAQDRL